MSKWKKSLPCVLLIGAAGLLIIGILNNGQDWGGDFSSYVMQAQSILADSPQEFIEANRFTIENTPRNIGPLAYPWGFPAMLAPIHAAFGTDMVALKVVGVVCYLLLLVLLAIGFRRHHTGLWRLCLVGLFAFNPTLLIYTNRITSDLPFMFFSTLCVIGIGQSVVEKRRWISPAVDGILLGILVALCCFIRSNGVLLLATLGITHMLVLAQALWRRRQAGNASASSTTHANIPQQSAIRGLWVYVLPYASYLIVTLLWRAFLPNGDSTHMDMLRQISLGGIKYHVFHYGSLLADFYVGAPYPFLIYALSLPLMIVGMISRRRTSHPMVVYIALSFVIFIFWPATQPLRYLFPILPLYISFVLSGLQVLHKNTTSITPTLRQAICLFPVVFVAASFLISSVSYAYENLSRSRDTLEGPCTQTSAELFAFVTQSTDPDSALIFFKPRVMRLMTGRKAFSTYNVDNFWRADHLVVYRPAHKQPTPEDSHHLAERGNAHLIYENSDFWVFRLSGLYEPDPESD